MFNYKAYEAGDDLEGNIRLRAGDVIMVPDEVCSTRYRVEVHQRRDVVKRTAIAVSMCFGMAPSMAYALDWSLKTSQIETIELNDNQFLRTSPAASVGSYSTITADAEALTPLLNSISTPTQLQKYWDQAPMVLPQNP